MPLNIRREDEEIYRNAEKIVNKYLEQYRRQFSQRSMEEILTGGLSAGSDYFQAENESGRSSHG